MARYVCPMCGYVYDESAEGASWDSLPKDWRCPVCRAAKSKFEPSQDAPQATGTKEAAGDKGSGASAVPASSLLQRAVFAHRVFGYVFLVIYVLMIVQMLPRLWTYQIEFPARTAIHIALGLAIGPMLLLKIAIVRFFRRLEQSLAPMLGTSMLVGSVVLIGFSVPAAFQEAIRTSHLFTPENRERVRTLLAQTDLDVATRDRLQLDSPAALRAGQRVLRQECIDCHDLRTVLARPRTPENWLQTVRRMADRTTATNPLTEDEQWQVTAYLIAISPQLQKSVQQQRVADDQRNQSKAAVVSAAEPTDLAAYDAAAAESVFQDKCSQCHDADLVDQSPPRSAEEAGDLVDRMVQEGLDATEAELAQIIRYLTETYATGTE